jgi:hypothetical protein
MFVLTGSKNSDGIHKVYDIIEQEQQNNYLVSDKLFEWNGKKFEILK